MLQLPDEVAKRGGVIATVGDIGEFWETAQSPIDQAALSTLVELVGSFRPPPDHEIIPAGIDRAQLERYPLRHRTMIALQEAEMLEGNDALTVGQCLSLSNFGIESLLDLMCVAELALTGQDSPRISTPANQVATDDPSSQSGAWGNFDDLLMFVEWITRNQKSSQSGAWTDFVDLLKALLDGAAEFHGAVTVGDALRLDLVHLASTIGIASALDSVVIQDLTTGSRIADAVCDRLATMMASMSPTGLLILNRRLFANSPSTLEEVAQDVDVTRERVREIQVRVQEKVDKAVGPEMGALEIFVAERLGPVAAVAEFESVIAGVFDDESSTVEVADLGRRILRSRLNYSCVDGICLNQTAMAVVAALTDTANELADDAGLIDEEGLRDHLPSDEWNDFFPQILKRCKFHRIGGRFALRDTGKARAKAALLDIGRPATREEIAEVSGLNPDRVDGQLSVIPTVARADKTRWGLAEWIDDVYEGIPAEIIQRINEDGGATSLYRLIDELPRLFGVSESSVRAYVGTLQFTLRDGYVSLADGSSITLRDLNDVIDGRDINGSPYWTFVVENRYFAGYSLVGFPPEIASELGCKPNGSTHALVDHPADCRDLSVIWRLSSATGASLGYLAEPLRRLGVNGGDRVRVVIKGPGVVELRHDGGTVDSRDDDATMPAESLLERMKNRRKVV